MKVVVLGGSGVFGSRLAQLLVRDGHVVWVAGRDRARAERVAAAIGAVGLAADRDGDCNALFAVRPDVIVDAAGPFRSDGDNTGAGSWACHYPGHSRRAATAGSTVSPERFTSMWPCTPR